jgi:hypothetical protein
MVVATTSSFMSSNVRDTFATGVPSCALTVPEIMPLPVGATVGKGLGEAMGEAVGDLLRDPIGESTVGDTVGEPVGKAALILSDGVSSIVKVISSGTPATPPPPALVKGVALRMFRALSSYDHEK